MSKSKKYVLGLLLFLGIGFSSITTTLRMNGDTKIDKNESDFEVVFSNVSIGSDDVSTAAISNDGKEIDYNLEDLTFSSDASVINFKISNNSSLYDATVSVTCSLDGDNKDSYDVVSKVNNLDSTTIEAKRKISGLITLTQLESVTPNSTDKVSCTLNAVPLERTTVGESVLSMDEMCPGCVYGFYNAGRQYGENGSIVSRSEFTEDYTEIEKPYFLGHILDETGRIKRVFTCGIKDDVAFCIEAGTTGLRFDNNKQILQHKTLWGQSCPEVNGYLRCNGSVSVNAGNEGYVNIYDANGTCAANSDGWMYCTG